MMQKWNIFSLNGTDWRLTGWYPNQWRPKLSMELGVTIHPAVSGVAATVPGSVQTDLLAAGLLPDPFVGLNSLHCEWVTQREWVYEKNVQIPAGWPQERCELVFEGLDYAGTVFWNDEQAAEFEGMFVPVVIDLTGRLSPDGENKLKVVFRLPPEVDGQVGYSSRIRHLKSRFNYAWDWCPRMVAVGIWRDVFIRTYHGAVIRDFYPHAQPLEMNEGIVDIRTEADIFRPGTYDCLYTVEDGEGRVLWEGKQQQELGAGPVVLAMSAELESIALWWPRGMGDQPLYRVRLTLLDEIGQICDTAERNVGFRRIEWTANPGAPAGAMPYTAVVNGIPVFLRGVNWVPASPYYGAVTEQDYRKQLDPLADMNANLLRVWGGGIIEKPAFYDYCDHEGLLVWQEFLQSSSALDNCPPDDPDLVKALSAAAKHAIREKRAHPSLLLWCGGNELMWEGFRPVDERHANIAMLARLVSELDPDRRFLPASASGPAFCASAADFGKGVHHDVHGPWVYAMDPDHYTFFNGDDALFRSETGTPGASRGSLLRELRGNCAVWPPTENNPYWVHRGSWWVPWETVSGAFGPWSLTEDELETFVMCSRFLQKESVRYAAEATLRRMPEASGFVVWMGNEPFPNCANTSILEWDGMPKPVFYALKKAFSPLHVSVRYDKASYMRGETFRGDLFLHGPEIPSEIIVHAVACDIFGRVLAESFYQPAVGFAVSPILLGTIDFALPELEGRVFFLRWELRDESGLVLSTAAYIYTVDGQYAFDALRCLPAAGLGAELAGGRTVMLHNHSAVSAVEVWLEGESNEGSPVFADNGIMLLPGELRAVSWTGAEERLSVLRLEGFNVRTTLSFAQ
ncbi:glycoside hydrolase family 2 TIM barrel-domain containing protein [Paenibacillus sp. GCM10027626]|uniref:glycoside hydrolase family 2 protein n=1 Tax=Paenibacillus sp. GCM10027626 TaxID=3273411 RepID=UPI0036278905